MTTARRGGSSNEIDYADRAVASLPYLVPLFDGLKYGMEQRCTPITALCKQMHIKVSNANLADNNIAAGKFVFMQYPIFMRFLAPLDPLVRLYFGFPFARYGISPIMPAHAGKPATGGSEVLMRVMDCGWAARLASAEQSCAAGKGHATRECRGHHMLSINADARVHASCSLIVFFAIYSGIVTNQSFSRYVRYNGMQSILLDILLM